MTTAQPVLRGTTGPRLQGDEQRADRTEVTATGATYDEA